MTPHTSPPPTPKRRLIISILALVILIMVLAALAPSPLGPREPAYHGRPLSYWMDIYYGGPPMDPTRLEAEAAIKEIGTNAIPCLAEWIQYEPALPTRVARELLKRLHSTRDPTWKPNCRAWHSMGFMVGLAQRYDLEAFPQMQRLADNPKPGPATKERMDRLWDILSEMKPVPQLYSRHSKATTKPPTNPPP